MTRYTGDLALRPNEMGLISFTCPGCGRTMWWRPNTAANPTTSDCPTYSCHAHFVATRREYQVGAYEAVRFETRFDLEVTS